MGTSHRFINHGEKIMKTRQTLFALIIAAPLAVWAQSTPGVDQRQANQQQRIDQGVRSGALTADEAARLDRGQERVQAMEDRAKADGKVTAAERRRLHRAENVESRRIARQKHDRQHDFNHDGKGDRKQRRAAAKAN